MKDMLHSAYVLHRRPYRDTSLLVELFVAEQGRMTAVARGARRMRSGWGSLLQPFQPLLVAWFGRQELVTLKSAEADGALSRLSSRVLACGFYLNELLMRLLHQHDPHPELFQSYHATLQQLASKPEQASMILRIFEKHLLYDLGYGIKFNVEAGTEQPINAEQTYYFKPDTGFIPRSAALAGYLPDNYFIGQSLMDLHTEQLSNPTSLKDAKRLMRLALQPLLGDKPIVSRELIY